MSMSQEEIEALMNGLDISEDDETTEEAQDETLSMEEIENLVSQSQDDNEESNNLSEDSSDDEEFDIDSLVNEFSNDENEESSEEISNDEIDDLINSNSLEVSNESLEDLVGVVNEIDSSGDDDTEDILGNNEELSLEEEITKTETPSQSKNESDDHFKNWADNQINEGKIPIPAENDAKVVNQLTQVANDSEEKVSQIFDVLSSTLDTNNEIRGILAHTTEVLESQKKLMETLSVKFPNVNVFSSNLNEIQSLNGDIDNINNHLMNEDNQIFQAMELMQFNDINRQKIERVMSVIRKLSIYLNNLFEDEGSKEDIVVAKHIHGDDNEIVDGDDLEKLIDEFNKRV